MRSIVYSVLCALCLAIASAKPTPPVEIFGAIDLNQIEKNLVVPIHAEDRTFLTEGVSLSFNIIELEETPSTPIFSVYGSNGYISYNVSAGVKQCVITVDTQFRLSVSYTLQNCSNTNIVIELYNSSTMHGTLVNLYQDLLYLNYDKQVLGNADQPGTTLGWCQYDDSYISGFLLNTTGQKAVFDTLDEAKSECIKYSRAGTFCRGIVHSPTDPVGYQLRHGEVPRDAPYYSTFPETTYLKAPCLNPGQVLKMTSDLTLYKQSKSLILSHVNLDKLSVNGKVDHADMYKRYEVGNLVPGSYISFTSIPYNISSYIHTHHPRLRKTGWPVWDKSFSLNEGCLLSTPSNSSEDFLKIFIGTKQARESRMIWNAAEKGYSLDLKGFCKYSNVEVSGKMSGYYSTPEEASTECAARSGCTGFTLSPNVYMPGKVYQIGYQLVNGYTMTSTAGVTSWSRGYCPAGGTGQTRDGWCEYMGVIKPPGRNTSHKKSIYMGHKAFRTALAACAKTAACSHVESIWDSERDVMRYTLNQWQGKVVQGNGTVWSPCGENYTSIDAWGSSGNLVVNKQAKAEVFCYEKSYPETEGIVETDNGSSISNSTSTNRCQWLLTQKSGRYIAVVQFSSDELASKFYFTQAPANATPGSNSLLTEQIIGHNRSSTAVFLFKFELAARTERIEVTSGPTNCNITVYRTDVCEPALQHNNYGSYYTSRTAVGEMDEIDCDGDSAKKGSWKCDIDGKWSYDGGCPFYWCYQKSGKAHDALYVGDSAPDIKAYAAGTNETGECCNSNWSFKCEEAYKVDYSGCEKLKSCTVNLVTISVNESTTDNSLKMYEVSVPASLAAKTKTTLDCPYGDGEVNVYCDGCMDQTSLEVKTHTCGPKLCPKSKIFNNPVYGRVNITFTDAPVYGDTMTAGCPYSPAGSSPVFTATCKGGVIEGDYSSCGKAPQCIAEVTDMDGGQIGSISWPTVYATEAMIQDCPYGGSATRNCSWTGTWAEPVSTCQKRTYCELTESVYKGVTFSAYNATSGSVSITACDHAMCDGFRNIEATKQCGYRVCNGETGEFSEADYSHCSFNCSDSMKVVLGDKSTEACNLSDGSEGKRDMVCKGDGKLYALTEGCLLKTCTEANPAGCFSSDISAASKDEVMAALTSGVDKLDLTSDANKDLVRGAVSALVPTEPDTSASASDLLKIVELVSKVANKLSQTGGQIETETVTMYGVLLESGARRKRAVLENERIGISGLGFTSGVGVSVYKDDAMFKSNATNTSKVAGGVMSITTSGSMDSISMQFEVPAENKSSNISNFNCVYYDTAKFTWSSEGCGNVTLGVNGKLVCECDHLTSFAVLVSLSEIDDSSQDMASGVFLTISAVCLILTLCAILPHKKIRDKLIMKVHLHLTFALLLATVAFLLIDYGNNKPGLCCLLAFLVHWLWLAVFGWMVVEGVTLYRQTVNALQSYGRPVPWYMLKNTIAVYGGALLFPTLGIIVGETTSWEYTTQPKCFLDTQHTLLAFFLIPLYIVLVVSIFFFVRVSYVIIQAKRQGTAGKEYWKRQLKAVISIAVVLGLAWVIAPLINIPPADSTAAKILNWIFIVICGSQGLTVFLIQVVFSEDVKSSWMGTYKDSEFERMTDSVMNKSRKFKGAVRATVTSNILMRTTKNGGPSTENGGEEAVEYNINSSSSEGKDRSHLMSEDIEQIYAVPLINSTQLYDTLQRGECSGHLNYLVEQGGECDPIYDEPIITQESPEYMDPDAVKKPVVVVVKDIE